MLPYYFVFSYLFTHNVFVSASGTFGLALGPLSQSRLGNVCSSKSLFGFSGMSSTVLLLVMFHKNSVYFFC